MPNQPDNERPVDSIHAAGEELSALAPQDEALGRLSDRTAAIMRESGVIRLLQPRKHGGLEAHPREFAETVMALARYNGSAGWVAGVVGVHPWEAAVFDPQLADEVWGEDPDTWIASPFSPTGIAEPVDGGYLLNGRWQFSSGTDHCQWIFLGAFLGDGNNAPVTPPQMLHVVLPRSDYQIVPDSWDVIGLSGTGSKDIIVKNAFIPAYRTLAYDDALTGTAAERAGRTEPLYRLPFGLVFPLGITSAVIGIVEGAYAHHVELQRGRVSVVGTVLRDDPYTAYFTAQAGADIHASRAALLDGVTQTFDKIVAGGDVTLEDRSTVRRNQARAAWRAVAALDEIFVRSGGNAIRKNAPLQRYWRDAHAGLQHMIHVPGSIYHANTLLQMGVDPPPALLTVV